MNIRDRLMSRASVAAMAAFAKPDPASTVPAFAERVEDTPADSGGSSTDPIDGLTAEEQAQIAAMQGGTRDTDGPPDPEPPPADGDDDEDELEPGADAPPPGDAPPEADREAPPADGERPAPKSIAYAKHQRELAKRQKALDDLQAQLDGARNETKAEREARLVLDARTKMLLEAIQSGGKTAPAAPPAPKVEEDVEPNIDDDPIAHAAWTSRELKRTQALVREMRDGVTQDRQQRQTHDADENVLTAATNEISAAATEKPEVAEAFVHYRESRYTELGYAYAGIDINDPAQCATLSVDDRLALSERIQQTFRNDCLFIAKQARQAQRPIVNEVMNYARARGYRPGAAAPAAPPAAGEAPPAPRGKTNGNGAAPPAPRADAAPTVTDQLEQIRANQASAKSLSDAGGAPGGTMTLERLAEMPAEDFERYYEALKDNGQLDKMMGKVPL